MMLKNSIPVLLLSLAAAVPAHAKGKHAFTFGGAVENYNYKEPKLMETKGKHFYGLEAGYRFQATSRLVYGLEARYMRGKTSYKSNSTGRHGTKTPNRIFESRGLLSGVFKPFDTTALEPFTGLGYRLKKDSDEGRRTSTGHYGYKRESQYWYIPLGARLVHTLNQSWSLAMKGEYDFLLRGRQKSWGSVMPKDKHTQKKGYGLKGEVMATCNMGHFDLSFGPYIHYWNIKNSDKNYHHFVHKGAKYEYFTHEPKNRTTETGAAVRVTF
ncbi:MAG: outer membrane beta-barrel protein [Holosporales bacterium]